MEIKNRSPRAEAVLERAMDIAQIVEKHKFTMSIGEQQTLKAIVNDLRFLSEYFDSEDSFCAECG